MPACFIESSKENPHSTLLDYSDVIGKSITELHAIKPPKGVSWTDFSLDDLAKWSVCVSALSEEKKFRFVPRIIASQDVMQHIRDLLIPFWSLLEEMWKDLEALSVSLGKRECDMEQDRVLVHRDIHGGNILIRQDGRLVLLDWEELAFGFPEQDLDLLPQIAAVYKQHCKFKNFVPDRFRFFCLFRIFIDLEDDFAKLLFEEERSNNQKELLEEISDKLSNLQHQRKSWQQIINEFEQ